MRYVIVQTFLITAPVFRRDGVSQSVRLWARGLPVFQFVGTGSPRPLYQSNIHDKQQKIHHINNL